MKPPVVLDLVDDYAIRQGMTYSLGLQIMIEPNSGAPLTMMDTAAMSARFKVRAGDYDGAVACEGSTDDGRIVLGYSPAPVARSTAYVTNQQVTASPFNTYYYKALNNGTTSASPVALSVTLGGITLDGSVNFANVGQATDEVVNAYIMLPATYTETLVDWGRGRWDFELVDGSTVFRLFEGVARLSREVTY